MTMIVDHTAHLRRSLYLIITWVAVAIAVGKILGVENVVEPSRFKPPSASHYGGDRPELQQFTKAWATT
jgi:hypothetical protein